MITLRENGHLETIDADRMTASATFKLPLEERVPNAEGSAFDFMTWYNGWTREKSAPSHFTVRGADDFTAEMPWSELSKALFVFADKNGSPLQKGGPLRLYVPDGSSACLNVKSVAELTFHHDPNYAGSATYGFRNRITAEELSKKKTIEG